MNLFKLKTKKNDEKRLMSFKIRREDFDILQERLNKIIEFENILKKQDEYYNKIISEVQNK